MQVWGVNTLAGCVYSSANNHNVIVLTLVRRTSYRIMEWPVFKTDSADTLHLLVAKSMYLECACCMCL